MIMPSVDYSPLYNAIDRRTGSVRAGFAAEGATLRMQQLDLNRGRLIADTVFRSIDTAVQVGQAIYGMAEAADLERGKGHAHEFSGDLEKLGKEYVHNNKYTTVTAEDGTVTYQMDPEFDQEVEQLKQEYLEKHKHFPTVKRWLDTTMTGQTEAQKAKAMGQFYSQEAQARNTLYASNIQDSVNASIEAGDPSVFRAQIMSSKDWRPMSMREQDLYTAQKMYDEGVQKKELAGVLGEQGLSGAYERIDAMDVTTERKQDLRNYAASLDNNNQISYGTQIQQIIEQAERDEKTPHEIAEIIQNTGIPGPYKEPAVRGMQLKGDMDTVDSVVATQGTQPAADWIKAQDYSSDEEAMALQHIGIARDKAVAEYTNQYTQKVVDNAKNGVAYESAFTELDKSNIPEEFKGQVEHDMTVQLGNVVDTAFLGQYNDARYNGNKLLNLRDAVQQDVYARYGRLPKMQKEHLDLLNSQLKALGIDAGGSGGANKDAALFEVERYRRMVKEKQISQYEFLSDLNDESTELHQGVMYELGPKAFTGLREELSDELIAGNPYEGYIKDVERSLDSTIKDLKIPEEKKAGVKAHIMGDMIRAVVYDKNATFDKLEDVRKTAELNAYGEVHDIMSAQYEHKDFTGTPTEKQLVSMQEMIDSGKADLSLDVASGEALFPPGHEQGYSYLTATQLRRTKEHLGLDPYAEDVYFAGFKPDGPNDITAQPIYVQASTGRRFTYHVQDGEMVLFELKDGEEVQLTKTTKQENAGRLRDALTLDEDQLRAIDEAKQKELEEKDRAGLGQPKRSPAAPVTGRANLQGYRY